MHEHLSYSDLQHSWTVVLTHLARRFIVALNDQLHAIGAHLEAIKKLKHIQLACIVWQALDLDHTVTLAGNGL